MFGVVKGFRPFLDEASKLKGSTIFFLRSIFLSLPQELVQLNKLSEKKVGVTDHFEISKNHFFLKQYTQKQACYSVNILTVNRQEI